jgi:hypothetical protein
MRNFLADFIALALGHFMSKTNKGVVDIFIDIEARNNG